MKEDKEPRDLTTGVSQRSGAINVPSDGLMANVLSPCWQSVLSLKDGVDHITYLKVIHPRIMSKTSRSSA